MSDSEYPKLKPGLPTHLFAPSLLTPCVGTPPYVELQVTSNFSFLRGASHPEELVATAAQLGYLGIALTDIFSLAGVVRAHVAAKQYALQYILGAALVLRDDHCALDLNNLPLDGSFEIPTLETFKVLAYALNREGYAALCRLLTIGKRRVVKGECFLTLSDLSSACADLAIILVPPMPTRHYSDVRGVSAERFCELACELRERSGIVNCLSIALSSNYLMGAHKIAPEIIECSEALSIPLVATNDVYYHLPHRRVLQDVLTCIRHRCTIAEAGFRLFENAERFLKSPQEMTRLFRHFPKALRRTLEIAEATSGFSLDQLRYEYPDEICPAQQEPHEYLRELVYKGASERYPSGVSNKLQDLLHAELALIKELRYERFFLTCYDIVSFARSKKILCQGRGAAANSAVCYCLGITVVDPEQIETLFARFVSKERNEPPDIDIDFEHERREEVIQYIYEKYGRDRAGLVAEVITYRQRSALREVAKALGLPQQSADALAKAVHRWTKCELPAEELRAQGLDPNSTVIRNILALSQELLGFPRHLSQHVGGFIISQRALCETVPILNAGMQSRTIIEWDKDDIEALGMLKVDVLALGILTCIQKALKLINQKKARTPTRALPGPEQLELHSIPPEDAAVYDMICASDTIGVFQIESRAQMSMLPRLKPRKFYDLVIEVAIVRPGPMQGNMVHPYLRRRAGIEHAYFPDARVEQILGKTLGVPIFQEQAMRLAIVLAKFSPGEAELLRRAMSAWKRNKGAIEAFKIKVIDGMVSNGYTPEFAESCMNQIKGFSEYGFPESHAASFAELAYASAWIKRYYPAIFTASLINSQPMGFYSSAQLINDLREHAVEVLPVDINQSEWVCTIEPDELTGADALRLGGCVVRGLKQSQMEILVDLRRSTGRFDSIPALWERTQSSPERLRKATLITLARADAFRSLGVCARQALWEIHKLSEKLVPLEAVITGGQYVPSALPQRSLQQSMFEDYRHTGLSLRAHPMQFMRANLDRRSVRVALSLRDQGPDRSDLATRSIKSTQTVTVAGIVLVRQRPGTAKGVVFLTLDDETGIVNLVIFPNVFEQFSKLVMLSTALLAVGMLERMGTIPYVTVSRLESLDHALEKDPTIQLPHLSYSY